MEKAGLDLTNFLAPEEKIHWKGGADILVPADLPKDLMYKVTRFQKISVDKLQEKDLKDFENDVKSILYTRNGKPLVDKFIKSLTWQEYNYVLRFVFNFIRAETESFEQVKKKGS